ncbi:SusC/RagA family TonB-linked outer membrane protein [Chitinophaga deserti]|uniref:SusC/RagA family TonB-linked outer membrane protein n=1 Tax=Chitinophaga deserti TaxID=2164099 RepID=UPI000D6AF939|nr:TonB-dependent receptor [Chitinophaga deserti]
MRKMLLLAVWLLCLSEAIAQSRTIRGKVTDATDNAPLPGVTVAIKGTGNGTITNAEGLFSLEVPATLRALNFSFVGYTPQENAIPASSVLNVQLSPDNKVLNEFIVSGYQVQRKGNGTGAVSSVGKKDIENRPVQSFDRAMQGKMAGVQVIASNGMPGGAISVRVRGVGSITGGLDPLYIVDGIQINSGDQTRNFPTSNALAGINPDDIESIQVLKDPASASIYGAQAANGVVLVTTKKGKAGKTKIGVGAYSGFATMLKKVPVLSTVQVVQLGWESLYHSFNGSEADKRAYADREMFTRLGTNKYDSLPNTDWQDELFRKGKIQNYELNLSGGNDKTNFYLSGSLNKFQGQVVNSDFTRGTFKFNLDHKASSKLQLTNGLLISVFQQNGVANAGSFDNPNRGGILIWPGSSPYNDDGSYRERLFGSYYINPLQVGSQNIYRARNMKMIGNLGAIYQLSNDFIYRGTLSAEYTTIKENDFDDPRNSTGAPVGRVNVYDTEILNWQTNHTLNFNKEIGRHNISALIGGEFRYNVLKGINASGTGIPNYLFTTLSAVATPTGVGAGFNDWKMLSGFGQATYTYADRYVLSGTLRRDGSSRFGANNRYGMFPSVSFMWRATQEPFLRDNPVVNDLKLRISYGETGNSLIGNYASRALFGLSGTYEGLPGAAPTQLAISNLTWESNKSVNFGADLSLLNDRVNIVADYFIANRTNLLLNKPLPNTSGFATVLQNVGSLKNSGLELELRTININGEFVWQTRFNHTFLKNRVTKLLDGVDRIGTSTVIGKPINSIFTYRYAGVNAGDGRPMWYDTLGNITYNTAARDRVYLDGTLDPDYYGGITNEFSYKNFSLNVFLQYSGGNYIYNQDKQFASRSGGTIDRNQLATEWARWTKPGDVTSVSKPFYPGAITGTGSAYSTSDRFFEKGDYMRIKELTLAYNLPKKTAARMGMSSARIYGTAMNLYTWSNYFGYDPELINGTTGDFGVYPQSKQVIFGLQVTF